MDFLLREELNRIEQRLDRIEKFIVEASAAVGQTPDEAEYAESAASWNAIGYEAGPPPDPAATAEYVREKIKELGEAFAAMKAT